VAAKITRPVDRDRLHLLPRYSSGQHGEGQQRVDCVIMLTPCECPERARSRRPFCVIERLEWFGPQRQRPSTAAFR